MNRGELRNKNSFKEIKTQATGIANKYDSKAQETVIYNRSSEEKVIRHCPDSVQLPNIHIHKNNFQSLFLLAWIQKG